MSAQEDKPVLPPGKIKITTDQHGFVRVYTPGGEELTHVVGLTITCKPGRCASMATLEVIDPDIDIDATIERLTTVEYRNLDRYLERHGHDKKQT